MPLKATPRRVERLLRATHFIRLAIYAPDPDGPHQPGDQPPLRDKSLDTRVAAPLEECVLAGVIALEANTRQSRAALRQLLDVLDAIDDDQEMVKALEAEALASAAPWKDLVEPLRRRMSELQGL